MRQGGAQRIPRPERWQLGSPPPWSDVLDAALVPLPPLLDALADLGPGRPPPLTLDEPKLSAVLVALFDGEHGAEVVLTRRAEHLRDHRGEVSFPGGRADPGETPTQTALREAHEEVLLDPATVTVIGELDHHATMVSRSLIVPIVGHLPARPPLQAATSEVDRILTVPLVELLRSETYREERWGDQFGPRSIYFFELDDETVWGATARILVQLLTVAAATIR
jgi:8-oxo-dGTP pyrophosphatase MutT (NUDIX family)